MLVSLTATAQETPYTLNVYNKAIYYGMYGALTEEAVPPGLIRHSNSSYGKMLTPEQLDSFGNTLTMTVTLSARCDTYDRIGNVNMVLVPKEQTTYGYKDANIKRIEIGRFITPFMRMTVSPNLVPFEYELNHLTNVFHDANIRAQYNIWIELEVYGYQGDASAGAVRDLPNICPGRTDVYEGSLDFTSSNDSHVIYGDDNFLLPLSFKYQLRDYVLEGVDDEGNPIEGTQVLDETVKTITFTLEEALPNAAFHLITSNHGAGNGGEEYIRRNHFVYLDNTQVSTYKPGGKSCEPFREYNTQPNCIYLICTNTSSSPRPDTDAAWSWNNWCPGDKIPNRVIELGNLAAGTHTFKIDVPSAVFAGNDGYFPMSVYLQSTSKTLSLESFNTTAFTIYPNPVTDVATIETKGLEIKAVTVVNTLGQTVFKGTSDKVDMSQLQSGIYMVKVQFDNNQTAVKKIVKN